MIHAQATANEEIANPRIAVPKWGVRQVTGEFVRRRPERDDERQVVEKLERRGSAVFLVRITAGKVLAAMRSDAHRNLIHAKDAATPAEERGLRPNHGAALVAELERPIGGEQFSILQALRDKVAQALAGRGRLGAVGILFQVAPVRAREKADLDHVAAGLADDALRLVDAQGDLSRHLGLRLGLRRGNLADRLRLRFGLRLWLGFRFGRRRGDLLGNDGLGVLLHRPSYGGAYIVMDSKRMGNDVCLAWPAAELAVMGAGQAAAILQRRATPEERAAFEADYSARLLNPYLAAERGYVDAVIAPSETRREISRALRMLVTKREDLRPRKHDNTPL